MWPLGVLLPAIVFLQGCGRIYDRVTTICPLTRDELSLIRAWARLHVGILAEPFRPFVFPAAYRVESIRSAGPDIELIREVADVRTSYCGRPTPIVPILHLTRFRNLFIKMNEGQLDLSVSSMSGTIPDARPTGALARALSIRIPPDHR